MRLVAPMLAVVTIVVGLSVVVSTAAAARPLAPAVSGMTLEGKRLSLRELRGRPVLVNVWSSW